MSRFWLAVLALLALALALAGVTGKSGKAHADGPGHVSGVVFYDKDMDGERDDTDPPLRGRTVELTTPDNPGTPRTTVSARDGSYRFTGLEEGVYYEVALRPDESTLCQTIGAVGLAADGIPAYDDIDLGMVKKGRGSISGIVLNDLNENGVHDPGEPPMGGWPIMLGGITEDQSGYCDLEAVSESNGSFAYRDLPPLAYSMSIWFQPLSQDTARQLWELTFFSPSEPGDAVPDLFLTFPKVSLVDRLHVRGVELGVHFLSGGASIAGMVFEDRDLDGMRDEGEPGIGSPPPIWLWRLVDGQLLGVENFPYPMQPSGRFEIAGLPAGTYYVAIADPYFSGTMPTAANGFPYRWVTVAEGQRAEGLDFGYAPQPVELLPSQTPAADSTPAMHPPDLGTGGAQGGGGMLPVILLLAAGVGTLGSGFALIRHSKR